jgi:hypothetical protein
MKTYGTFANEILFTAVLLSVCIAYSAVNGALMTALCCKEKILTKTLIKAIIMFVAFLR